MMERIWIGRKSLTLSLGELGGLSRPEYPLYPYNICVACDGIKQINCRGLQVETGRGQGGGSVRKGKTTKVRVHY